MFKALAPHASPLSLAVGALAGCAVYYALAAEPVWWAGLAVMAAGWVILAAGALWNPLRLAGLLVLAAGAYFCLAQGQVVRAGHGFNWQQAVAKAPWAVGLVEEVAPGKTPGRAMLTLKDVKLYGMAGSPAALEKLRAGVGAKQAAGLKENDALAFPVQLFAPEGPRFPGEGDYRLLRFVNPGAPVGFARGPLQPTFVPEAPPHPIRPYRLDETLRGLAEMTDVLREKVRAATAPYGQGVITALLVADERQIPQELRNAYRGAGLSHLLAVSGLQLTLVGGGVFWLTRWLLALWPALALEVNGKALGAVTGLLAASAYTVLAGAPVSVQRALVMVAILLLAVVMGRLRSLLRSWCIAVLLVLAWDPAAAMMAGFQLSFAAVLGLILLGMAYGHPAGWMQKARWLFRSSVVAAWATAPIIAAQFAQLNVLGVLANLVAIPAMTPVTLLAFAGLAAMPVGGSDDLFKLAGRGADWVNLWAMKLAAVPLATVMLPPWAWVAVLGVAAVVLALIYARVWGASLLGFVALVALGLLAWQWQQRMVEEVIVLDGGNAAVLVEGHQARALWGADGRAAERWQQVNNLPFGASVAGSCDGLGCVYPTPVGAVLDIGGAPLPEDCAQAALVVAGMPGGACPAKTVLTDRVAWARLRKEGIETRRLACGRPWQSVAEACWPHRKKLSDAGE